MRQIQSQLLVNALTGQVKLTGARGVVPFSRAYTHTPVLFDTVVRAAYSAVEGSPHLPRAHHVSRRARNFVSTALGSRRRTGSYSWPGEISGNV